MQYLVSVIDDTTRPAASDEQEASEQAATDVLNDRMKADGYWVYANGLASPDAATVIDNRGSDVVITDGPFVESKEFLAGFWIIDVPDFDVAMTLATEGSKACNRRIELRPMHGG